MPSTFSPSLRLELIASGSQSGVWGVTTNNNLGDLIEQAISGATPLNVTGGNITLTALNGVPDQARSAVLNITGTPGTPRDVIIPNVRKAYTVRNRANDVVNLKTATGTPYVIPALSEAYIYCDGSNVITGRTITDAADAFTANPAPLNNLALTGVPIAPTAPAGTNTTQIATTAFVNSALPIGSIIMWFGTVGNIPTGWAVCDGTNGTPDLRDRFVVGAGSTYSVGDTGGVNAVALTTAEIPSHTHSISGSGTTSAVSNDHTHSGTTGINNVDHVHGFSGSTSTASLTGSIWIGGPPNVAPSGIISGPSANGGRPGLDFNSGNVQRFDINASHGHTFSGTTGGQNTSHVHGFTTGGQSANHTHTFSFSGTSGATGSGSAHENRPPYFALYLIMRI
jgi:microcystin-dependent protein